MALCCCRRLAFNADLVGVLAWYFALSANQGFTDGEHNLGCFYKDGEGTEVDLGKARYWLERAAAKGDEDAIEALADLERV